MSDILNSQGWHERNSEEQPLKSALEHYRYGRTCVYNCDAVGAEKSFRKALRVIPEMPEVLGGLASVALGHGTFQNALEFSDRAIASAPAYSRGWLNRSVARHCLKDKAGALSDAIHATKLTPTHSMAWVVLAGVYSDLDPPQFKDAQTAIEAAEQFVDEDGSTTSAKLELLVAMGDMAKAKALIAKTNQFSFVPMVKERLLSLEANIAIGERRFEEARTILLSLTEPPYSSYRFNAAHAWYRLATLEVSRGSPPARLHSALQYVTRATTLCVETSAFLSWETWLRVTLASHTSGHEAARMFRQAIKTADAAIRISPEDTDLRMWRASAARNLAWSLKDGVPEYSIQERLAAFFRKDDYSESADALDLKAVDDLTIVVSRLEQHSSLTADQQTDLEYVLAERADSFFNLGRYDEAIADIQRLRTVSGDSEAEKELLDDCLTAQADRL